MPKIQSLIAASIVFSIFSCRGEDSKCWREISIPVSTQEINTVWGTSSDDVFAIGDVVLHFNGEKWREVELAEDLYAYPGVWGIPGRYFFLKTDWRSGVIITEYDGSNWSDINTGVVGWPIDIWGSSTNDIFVVGYDKETIPDGVKSRILHFDGDTWSEMENNFSISLLSIWGSSSTDVFAVGDHSILHYDGNSWSVMEENLPYPLKTVWGASKDSVYASGGATLHYDGLKWTELNAHGAYDIWVSPDSGVFMVGGTIPAIYSDGTDWISMCNIPYYSNEEVYFYFNEIWGASREDVFVVGSKQHWGSYSEGIILRSNFEDDLNCRCE